MWRVAAWAVVLLAPLPAVQAQDSKKKDAQDLRVAGKLAADDTKDKVTNKPSQVHEFKMKAGTTYIIDMKSKQFDSFLRLEDSEGKELAKDDDSGGFPDARIIHKASKDGTYKIIATAYDDKVGAYTLTARATTEAYAKLQELKSEYQKELIAAKRDTEAVSELQLKFLQRFCQSVKDSAADDGTANEAKILVKQLAGALGNSNTPSLREKLRTFVSKSEDKEITGAANLALGQQIAKQYEAAYLKKDKAAAAKFSKEAESILQKAAKQSAIVSDDAKEALYVFTNFSLGRKAMEIDGEDIDGKKFKLSDYRGKVVVIDFWGNW
jgi:hypothetical protein